MVWVIKCPNHGKLFEDYHVDALRQLDIPSNEGELSTKSVVWARFTHTRGDAYEAQCSVFEDPMLESVKHGNPNSRCVEVGFSTEEVRTIKNYVKILYLSTNTFTDIDFTKSFSVFIPI